jgi:hypothetical protein
MKNLVLMMTVLSLAACAVEDNRDAKTMLKITGVAIADSPTNPEDNDREFNNGETAELILSLNNKSTINARVSRFIVSSANADVQVVNTEFKLDNIDGSSLAAGTTVKAKGGSAKAGSEFGGNADMTAHIEGEWTDDTGGSFSIDLPFLVAVARKDPVFSASVNITSQSADGLEYWLGIEFQNTGEGGANNLVVNTRFTPDGACMLNPGTFSENIATKAMGYMVAGDTLNGGEYIACTVVPSAMIFSFQDDEGHTIPDVTYSF